MLKQIFHAGFAGALQIAAANPVYAQETQPLQSYEGYYEIVGRSDGDKPKLVDDIIELRAAPVIGLKLETCAHGSGWLKYDTVKNDQIIMIGRLGREKLFCSIFHDKPEGEIFGCVIGTNDESQEKPGRLFLWLVSKLDRDLTMKDICG